jgi:LacI family transcriptional regulator
MARGIEDQVEDRGWTLMLASSDQRVEREQRALDLFTEHGVAGVIAVPASEDLTALERLESRGTPVVLLDHPSPSAQLPSVAVDNVSGGRLAAAHLFGQGHRQLVMFNGPHSVRQCRDRWEGALAAAVGAGLDPAESVSQVLLDSMDIEGGAEAGRQWLAAHGGRQPEAVFCVNDLVGIGLQRALREAGFDPARSAIVGYDDTDLAREIALPLTSVVQPTYEMGRRAAGLLLQVRAQGVVEHVVFQPELVIRASSSPPGQS